MRLKLDTGVKLLTGHLLRVEQLKHVRITDHASNLLQGFEL